MTRLDPISRLAVDYLAAIEKQNAVASSEQWMPPTVHPKQQAFLALDCDEALYGGAAGGGKSEALLRAALQYVHVPDYSAMLFRRTYQDLALPGSLMDRAHDWLDETAAKWSDKDKRWTFPSGATLSFGYMDGPRDHMRYKSMELQFCGFDELTEFLEFQYTYLFSRLRRKENMADIPLRMRAATNPGDIGHEWVGRRWNIPPEANQGQVYEFEGRVFVPARAEDNPSLDLPAYERMLDKLDPVTRQQLREGHWVRDTSGLVYSSFDPAKNRTKALPAIDGEWSHILGCDFGVTDPTAFVVLAFSQHHDTAYVVRSEQWKDLAPSQAAEMAKEWDAVYHFERIVGDTGGLGKAYETEWRQRYYLPMHAAQKTDKLGYIKLLNGDLYNSKLRILPGNDELLRDLRSLAWSDDKHTKEHSALPNHLPDALLYAWRDARHWDWSAPDESHLVTEFEAQLERERTRKERIVERNRKLLNDDDNDWIMGPEA